MARAGDDPRDAPKPAPVPPRAAAPPAAPHTYTVLDFAHALEAALGVPQSKNNDTILVAWQRAEGNPGWSQYNPYNIAATSVGQGSGGTARFRDWNDGVAQTAAFIRHGYYTKILASLAADAPPEETARAIGESPWASGHYYRPGTQSDPGYRIVTAFGGDGNYSPGDPSGVGAVDSTGKPLGSYQQFQYLAGDVDIGPLLQQLANGEISDAEFINRVQGTTWWRQHSGAARAWQQLKAGDPASYNQQLATYSRQIVEQALQLGVGLDMGTILKLADQWGASSWTPQDVTNAIPGYSKGGQASGGLAAGEEQIRKVAASYGVNLDDRAAYDYELRIAKNQATLQGLSADFAAQAARRFPHLSDELAKGFTLADLFQPYSQQAAQTLEIDPSQIDLADPKWSRALATHDGTKARQMTAYEWNQTLLSDPTYGWKRTQNAQASIANLTQFLDQSFGVGVS